MTFENEVMFVRGFRAYHDGMDIEAGVGLHPGPAANWAAGWTVAMREDLALKNIAKSFDNIALAVRELRDEIEKIADLL